MSVRVAINGFGRIGRNVLRAIVEAGRDDIDVIAINDWPRPKPTLTSCAMTPSWPLSRRGDGQRRHHRLRQRRDQSHGDKDPTQLPWKELDIDVALECTGIFTSKEKARLT